MKLILFLLFCQHGFSQSFGDASIHLNPLPEAKQDMLFYKWYSHPQENNIYIINFEISFDGFMQAFSEAQKLLAENNLDFSKPYTDSSLFHPDISKSATFEDLHKSISENKSKIFRTWAVKNDYLSMLLRNDVCMLILGNKRAD